MRSKHEHQSAVIEVVAHGLRWAGRLPDGLLLDMVFIDADHTHEQSLADFINIAPHVRPGGSIAMHDTYPRNKAYTAPDKCGGVYKTAWHIRQHMAGEFEIATLPFYNGVSIIRRTAIQLDWMHDDPLPETSDAIPE